MGGCVLLTGAACHQTRPRCCLCTQREPCVIPCSPSENILRLNAKQLNSIIIPIVIPRSDQSDCLCVDGGLLSAEPTDEAERPPTWDPYSTPSRDPGDQAGGSIQSSAELQATTPDQLTWKSLYRLMAARKNAGPHGEAPWKVGGDFNREGSCLWRWAREGDLLHLLCNLGPTVSLVWCLCSDTLNLFPVRNLF